MTQRISPSEVKILEAMVAQAKANEFTEFKNSARLPCPNDPSLEAANQAVEFLKEAFITKGFSLLDAIVATTGKGPASSSDTHYRGRVLEAVLNGSFDGKPQSDFAYAELKATETKTNGDLCQIITAGAIFTKRKGQYDVVTRYEDSKFVSKLKRTIIVGYEKVGQQLGFDVKNVTMIDINDPRFAQQLKEDWESISQAMVQAIQDERDGKIVRKASGILSAKHKTPNGLLGVRSDSVTLTNKFYRLISD